jgi:hypothetical protein
MEASCCNITQKKLNLVTSLQSLTIALFPLHVHGDREKIAFIFKN